MTDSERPAEPGAGVDWRDRAMRAEAHIAIVDARIAALEGLLRERHDFPDYPTPIEGEVGDDTVWAEQEAWRRSWAQLDQRIRAALARSGGG